MKRTTWPRATDAECNQCNARAQLKCGCTSASYEGRCQSESLARSGEPDCSSDVTSCVGACAADCTCQEDCYRAHEKCRVLTTKLNSCLADVCDPSCR